MKYLENVIRFLKKSSEICLVRFQIYELLIHYASHICKNNHIFVLLQIYDFVYLLNIYFEKKYLRQTKLRLVHSNLICYVI